MYCNQSLKFFTSHNNVFLLTQEDLDNWNNYFYPYSTEACSLLPHSWLFLGTVSTEVLDPDSHECVNDSILIKVFYLFREYFFHSLSKYLSVKVV